MNALAVPTLRSRTRIPALAIPLLLLNLAALQGCDVVTADLKHTETAEWRKTYELSTGGRVEISNVNGKIQVTPSTGNTVEVVAQKTAKAATTEGGAKLECTNGGIKLALPADSKASISASITNGGIDASGLTLDTTQASRRRLEGRMNGGGAPVHIEGTNGGIRIAAR
jgi:hypothetical protein